MWLYDPLNQIWWVSVFYLLKLRGPWPAKGPRLGQQASKGNEVIILNSGTDNEKQRTKGINRFFYVNFEDLFGGLNSSINSSKKAFWIKVQEI